MKEKNTLATFGKNDKRKKQLPIVVNILISLFAVIIFFSMLIIPFLYTVPLSKAHKATIQDMVDTDFAKYDEIFTNNIENRKIIFGTGYYNWNKTFYASYSLNLDHGYKLELEYEYYYEKKALIEVTKDLDIIVTGVRTEEEAAFDISEFTWLDDVYHIYSNTENDIYEYVSAAAQNFNLTKAYQEVDIFNETQQIDTFTIACYLQNDEYFPRILFERGLS